MLAWVVMLTVFAAIPPLSDAQRDSLASATDDSPRLEEPAMQGLLTNVLQWEDVDEAGAQVPDYTALLTHPAAGRGGLYLIEGRFAGRARRYKLAQENPWLGDALTEWVLLVRDDPEEVAVVYFVDPDGSVKAPTAGAKVRVVGRFYKVWADTDQDGTPTRYLTFVARGPSRVGQPVSAPPVPTLALIVIVAGLGVAYLWVRRMGREDIDHVRFSRASHRRADDAILSDPVKALERLAGRHDQS